MLVDTQYRLSSKKLIVSYVDKEGEIKLKYYDWPEPTEFINCDEKDPDKTKYISWDGKPTKKVPTTHPDRFAIYEFLDALPKEEQDIIFEYNVPKIFFIDIETRYTSENGYSNARDADNEVLSISIVHEDTLWILGLLPMPKDMQKRIIDNTNTYFKNFNITYKFVYKLYDDEFSMLYDFFNNMMPKMPMTTGWNYIRYDWQYLVNRCKKIFKVVNGKKLTIDPSVSSPTKKMVEKKIKDTDIIDSSMPLHRMIFDYMHLYEAFDTRIKVKESSSLDFVSKKLVNVDKIKYNGSLQKLYDTDFEKFMFYNAVDSILVQKIHESQNYISIVYAISDLAKMQIRDIITINQKTGKPAISSIPVTVAVLRNRFRDMRNIVLFRQKTDKSEDAGTKIAGGWVKEPLVGMNQWCATYDFSSLYPTLQRQHFIAPELYVGTRSRKTPNKTLEGVDINPEIHTVTRNDKVFLKEDSPSIRMLSEIFSDRKKYKKLMLAKKEEYNKVLQQIEEYENNKKRPN